MRGRTLPELKNTLYIFILDGRKRCTSCPKEGGGGEVIRAMPERKHFFLQEGFPNRRHLFGQNDFNPQYIFISACSSPGLLWGDGGQLVHGLQDHHRLHVIVSCFVIWTLSKNDLPPFFWSILLFFERSQFICNISRIEEIFLCPWVKSISVTIHIHVSQSFLTKTQSWYLHRI